MEGADTEVNDMITDQRFSREREWNHHYRANSNFNLKVWVQISATPSLRKLSDTIQEGKFSVQPEVLPQGKGVARGEHDPREFL